MRAPFKTFAKSFAVPVAAGLLALGIAAASPAIAQSADSPFASFSGTWSGVGTVTASGGINESLRCRATYQVGEGGRTVNQSLRCASDSYKFDIVCNVSVTSGSFSGTWTETTRSITGDLSGSATPGQIRAIVNGGGFSAGLGITVQGNQQNVVIRPQAGEITGINITMKKG